MKNKFSPLFLAAALLGPSAFAAEKIEVLNLDQIAIPKRWAPAESSVALDQVKFSGHTVLKWVTQVDHFAGEPKYPVGWPRMYMTNFNKLQPHVPSNWQDWDFFEFDVKMKLENDPLNKNCPVTFVMVGSLPIHNVPLKKLHDGKIHRVRIPIDRVNNPAKMTRFGFSIAEANYKHGAKLTVQAGNFHLTRSSVCNIEKVKITTPALTVIDAAVKLQLQVTGPANDVARGVPFTLSKVGSSKVIRKEMLPVQRGEKEIEIEIDDLKLEPGDYTIELVPGDKARSKKVSFKLLSSPYKVKK